MPAYRIHGRNILTNEPSIETISADSPAAAWEATRTAGLFVSRIEALAASAPLSREIARYLVQVPFVARFAGQRQSLSRARAMVYRALQRAAELGSGPTQSLAHLKDRTQNIEMDDAIPGLLDKKYLTIADALASYPKIFPARDVALIRAHQYDASKLASVYRDLIERSMIEQTQQRQAFSERMDAYLTYLVAAVVIVAIVPIVASETSQGNAAFGVHLGHNLLYELMQGVSFTGLLLQKWWVDAAFVLTVAALIQGAQRFVRASEERASRIERAIWKIMPHMEDSSLDLARIDAIEQIANANINGIDEHHAALDNAIAASASPTFRIMLRRLGNRPSSQSLGEAIAAEPLWGAEIQGYFGALTGDGNTAKTTWGHDILDLCRQLREDEAANRTIRRLSMGLVHMGIGFAVSMGLTLLMTFIPVVQAIAISAK